MRKYKKTNSEILNALLPADLTNNAGNIWMYKINNANKVNVFIPLKYDAKIKVNMVAIFVRVLKGKKP